MRAFGSGTKRSALRFTNNQGPKHGKAVKDRVTRQQASHPPKYKHCGTTALVSQCDGNTHAAYRFKVTDSTAAASACDAVLTALVFLSQSPCATQGKIL